MGLNRAFLAVPCCAALLALTAGCSGDGMTARQRQTARVDAFCADLGALRMDAGKLADLDPRWRGAADVRDLRADAAHDLELVRRSAEGVPRAGAGAVADAYDEVRRAVDALPGNVAAPDAVRRIRPQLAALDQAIAASQAAVKC
ncbi:hypothetical protein C6N75_12240 [Streptomyces solincola]|uniref:Lipoprotein n=1 Tax=Streptomyces solincola TaxID=2100817 RepID=A0A2S9PWZ8_9ACTN|nr:hypothetical protein [Streptomyces solincola]PRH78954.1 hypothetical protein C6N75_12240 [Streptomyces solincola]